MKTKKAFEKITEHMEGGGFGDPDVMVLTAVRGDGKVCILVEGAPLGSLDVARLLIQSGLQMMSSTPAPPKSPLLM